jgi:predicted hydrocarbon binding protein
MNRRSFVRDCLGGVCACAAAGAAPVLAAAPAPGVPEDRRLAFIQARYGKLLEILSVRHGDAEVDATLRELGRFCASGMSLLARHRSHVDDFAREFGEEAGESVTVDHARGIITVVGPERTDCYCPLVDHLTCPKTVCCCSLGWQQQVYETLLGRPVEVRLVESVVRGGKRCRFEVRFNPNPTA